MTSRSVRATVPDDSHSFPDKTNLNGDWVALRESPQESMVFTCSGLQIYGVPVIFPINSRTPWMTMDWGSNWGKQWSLS